MAFQKASMAEEYNELSLHMEETRRHLQALKSQEQKKLKLRQFLHHLAGDESLETIETGTLADLLYYTEYPLCKEMVFDYRTNHYVPSSQKPSIDLAELLTLALRKQGIDKSFDELMDHILQGGCLEEFLR